MSVFFVSKLKNRHSGWYYKMCCPVLNFLPDTNDLEYVVQNIDEEFITLIKMAINGKLIPKDKRTFEKFKIDILIEKEFKYLYVEVTDKKEWPKTLNEAVYKLVNYFNEDELNLISKLSWNEFDRKYLKFAQLIRNKFGLWRGNFDLLEDCKIDDIDADNASISILYHFWEFITNQNNLNSTNNEKSLTNIIHYPFLSGVINMIIESERIIIDDKTNLFEDKYNQIFDEKIHVNLMIERYLFIAAIIKHEKYRLDITEMTEYVTSLSMKVYKLSYWESIDFINKRKKFYEFELELLGKSKYPLPIYIIWRLYNPSNFEIDTFPDLTSFCVSSIYLYKLIRFVFQKQLSTYLKDPNL